MTLVVLALAWLLGIAATGLWDAPAWIAGAWLAAALPLGYALRGRRAAMLLAGASVAALLGAARYHDWETRPLPPIAIHQGATVSLEGRIVSEPDPGTTTTSYVVSVDRVLGEAGGPTGGRVRVTLGQFAALDYGEVVRVSGDLEEAPVFDGFDYRAYLLRHDIAGTMYYPELERLGHSASWQDRSMRTLIKARLALERSLQRALPEPEASLAVGIAFGRDSNLPPELYDEFRATGLAHIVAVSGSNVLLVAALTFWAWTPLVGRRRATTPAAVSVIAYVLIAGLSPSVVRAGVMAGVYLMGAAIGRPRSALPALGIAAVAMTALHPATAAEAGFQLSLAATAGLVVLGPWIESALAKMASATRYTAWLPHGLLQVAAITLSASFATLPITWVTFGQVSLVGIATNVIVEPAFVAAFWGAVLTAVAGLAWEPLGWALGVASYYPVAFIAWVAAQSARLPFASVEVVHGNATRAFLALAGLSLLGWPAYRRLPPARPRAVPLPSSLRKVATAGLAGGVVAAVVPITLLPIGGPGDFELTMLDVGQGDAILLTTPHGKRILVDGGPSGIELARELGATMPHWERRIDAIFLTHAQIDHLAGLPEALDRFAVGQVYDTGVPGESEAYAEYLDSNPKLRHLAAGDSLEVDGVRITVLWPPAGYDSAYLNDTSLVLRVTYRDTIVLLAGDTEASVQRALLAAVDVGADVLKVPHHGSRTSDAGFLGATGAAIALISVGEGNPYGHPHADVLEALEASRVYRTDLDGRIRVTTDGSRLRVRTERRR